MTIILSDFYKDEIKAIEMVGLQDELEYHLLEYGCKPKKNIFYHFLKR